MNSEQKQKLQKLLCEAKKDNPNEIVMELLLFDLNMSIICHQIHCRQTLLVVFQ